MLIENALSRFHHREYHEIQVEGDRDSIYQAIRTLDLSGSWLLRLLFALRGLPPSAIRIETIQEMGFILLDETAGEELLLGLVGQFWKVRGGIRHLSPEAYYAFEEAGYAKVAWNFAQKEVAPRVFSVSTETRVYCTDAETNKQFTRYWRLIRPFSGLTRRIMLKTIAQSVRPD